MNLWKMKTEENFMCNSCTKQDMLDNLIDIAGGQQAIINYWKYQIIMEKLIHSQK